MSVQLPPHWQRLIDPSGRPYYVNHETRTTSWEAPLPVGWEEQVDATSGRKFYIDHTNRRTSWEDPRLLYSSAPTGIPAGGSPAGAPSAVGPGIPGPAAGASPAAGSAPPAGGAPPASAAPGAPGPGHAAPMPGGPLGGAVAGGVAPVQVPSPGPAGPAGDVAIGAYPGDLGGGSAVAGGAGGHAGGTSVDGSAAARTPPYEQKDEDADRCNRCGDEFGFFKHRHGCRCCGYKFCTDCLPASAKLPWLGSKEEKVCQGCAQHLSSDDPLCISRFMLILTDAFPDPSKGDGSAHAGLSPKHVVALHGVSEVLYRAGNAFARQSVERGQPATVDAPSITPGVSTYAGGDGGSFVAGRQLSDPNVALAKVNVATLCRAVDKAFSVGGQHDSHSQSARIGALRAVANTAAACWAINDAKLRETSDLVARSGVIPTLLSAVSNGDSDVAVEAARCIMQLSRTSSHAEIKDTVRAARGIMLLCDALLGASEHVQEWTVCALRSLMSGSPDNRTAVRENGGLVGLASILEGAEGASEEKCTLLSVACDTMGTAMTAEDIEGAGAAEANRAALVDAGAVRGLALQLRGAVGVRGSLGYARLKAATHALKALHLVSSSREGCEALLPVNAIQDVVSFAGFYSERPEMVEKSLLLLLNANTWSAACRRAIIDAGFFTVANDFLIAASENVQRHTAQLVQELAADPTAAEPMAAAGTLSKLCTLLPVSTGIIQSKVLGAVAAAAVDGSTAARVAVSSEGGAEAIAELLIGGSDAGVCALVGNALRAVVEDEDALAALPRTAPATVTRGILTVLSRADSGGADVESTNSLLVTLGVLLGDGAGGGVTARSLDAWRSVVGFSAPAGPGGGVNGVGVLTRLLSTSPDDGVRAAALGCLTAAAQMDSAADILVAGGLVDALATFLEGASDTNAQLLALDCIERLGLVRRGGRGDSAAAAGTVQAVTQVLRLESRRPSSDMRIVARVSRLLAQVSHHRDLWPTIARDALPLLVDVLLSDRKTEGIIEADAAKVIGDLAAEEAHAKAVLELGGVLALVGMIGQTAMPDSQAAAVRALSLLVRVPDCQRAVLRNLAGDGSGPLATLPVLLQVGAAGAAGSPRAEGGAGGGPIGDDEDGKADADEAKDGGGDGALVAVKTPVLKVSAAERRAATLSLLDGLLHRVDPDTPGADDVAAIANMPGLVGQLLSELWAPDPEERARVLRVLLALGEGGGAVWRHITGASDVRAAVALLSQGSGGVAAQACSTLKQLCRDSASSRERLLENEEAVSAMTKTLRARDDVVRSGAADCIVELLDDERMVVAVARPGGTLGLVDLVSAGLSGGGHGSSGVSEETRRGWASCGLRGLVTVATHERTGQTFWDGLIEGRRALLLRMLGRAMDASAAPGGSEPASLPELAAQLCAQLPDLCDAGAAGPAGGLQLTRGEVDSLVMVTKACVRHVVAGNSSEATLAAKTLAADCLSCLSKLAELPECGEALLGAGATRIVCELLDGAFDGPSDGDSEGKDTSADGRAAGGKRVAGALHLLEPMLKHDTAGTAKALAESGALPSIVQLLVASVAAYGSGGGAEMLRRATLAVRGVAFAGPAERAALADAGAVAAALGVLKLSSDAKLGDDEKEGEGDGDGGDEEEKSGTAAEAKDAALGDSGVAPDVVASAMEVLAQLSQLGKLRASIAGHEGLVETICAAAMKATGESDVDGVVATSATEILCNLSPLDAQDGSEEPGRLRAAGAPQVLSEIMCRAAAPVAAVVSCSLALRMLAADSVGAREVAGALFDGPCSPDVLVRLTKQAAVAPLVGGLLQSLANHPESRSIMAPKLGGGVEKLLEASFVESAQPSTFDVLIAIVANLEVRDAVEQWASAQGEERLTKRIEEFSDLRCIDSAVALLRLAGGTRVVGLDADAVARRAEAAAAAAAAEASARAEAEARAAAAAAEAARKEAADAAARREAAQKAAEAHTAPRPSGGIRAPVSSAEFSAPPLSPAPAPRSSPPPPYTGAPPGGAPGPAGGMLGPASVAAGHAAPSSGGPPGYGSGAPPAYGGPGFAGPSPAGPPSGSGPPSAASAASSGPPSSDSKLDAEGWRCPSCTYDNPDGRDKCDMCGVPQPGPRRPSAASVGPAGSGGAPAPGPSYPSVSGPSPGPPAYPPRPAASGAPSAASSGGPPGSWTCTMCTYANTKAEALACEVCGAERKDDAAASGPGAAPGAMAATGGPRGPPGPVQGYPGAAPRGPPGPGGPRGPPGAPGGAPATRSVKCGNTRCGKMMAVPVGAPRVICGSCGALNNVGIACVTCAFPLTVPPGTTTFSCPRCRTQHRMGT